jgi:MYXO-CTERM domain-containing protein
LGPDVFGVGKERTRKMRAHTTLRTAFRFGMMTAVAAGVSFAATAAHADVTNPGTSSGGAANSSTGTAALKYDYTKGLDTNIDTGWKGPKVAQIRAVMKLDPVKNGGPLYTIDMPKGAIVEASWGTDKQIVLRASNGEQTDGTVKVRHSITPSLDLKIEGFGLSATFGFDANKLVNKLPGARFAYDSQATQAFAPWGFTAVDTKLNAPDVKNSTLFSLPLEKWELLAEKEVEGTIGIRATTKPTFSYKTTKVMLSGTDGVIDGAGGEVTMPATDGDYMEVMATVQGEMNVAGSMDIQPFLALTKVLGSNVSLDFGVPVFKQDYKVPTAAVEFQAAVVHIPLPNVHVPREGVDIGAVKAGGSATKSITIENSGEKDAVMSFSSSDGAFAVPSGSVTVPAKGTYDLAVKFNSATAGPALAEITVASNDPDSPEQMFKIGANGADVGGPDGEDGDLPTGADAASGCGCKTAGGTSTLPSWAGLGLAGLGAVVFVRRRRKAA